MFDIDIPGKITFKESTNLSPGNELTTFDTRSFRILFKINIIFPYVFASILLNY